MDERSGPLAGPHGGAPVAVVPAGGLSAAEAAERAGRFGPNMLTAGRTEPGWLAFIRQYSDPMQVVLVTAAAWPESSAPIR